MIKQKYIGKLVNIQGFKVKSLSYLEVEEETQLVIELGRIRKKYQGSCGKGHRQYYDSEYRTVRDLSYGPYRKVWLRFYQCRIECKNCGIKTEWVEPRVRYTIRLAAAVALSCEAT